MKVSLRKIASNLKRELLYQLSATQPQSILFDHLPKCGGSTLTKYLAAHYPRRKIFTMDGRSPSASVQLFQDLPEAQRYEYRLIQGHLANELLDFVSPECLRVTVLREPVDRIISHYYYSKRSPNHYLYPQIHREEMSLEDYASSNLSGELRNWYTTHFSGMPVEVAEKNPEESIAKAAEVLVNRFNLIGFLDNFSLFVEKLRGHANLKLRFNSYSRANVTQDRPSLECIPQSTVELIQQINFLDMELYRKIRIAIR